MIRLLVDKINRELKDSGGLMETVCLFRLMLVGLFFQCTEMDQSTRRITVSYDLPTPVRVARDLSGLSLITQELKGAAARMRDGPRAWTRPSERRFSASNEDDVILACHYNNDYGTSL
jgi:hypothetical protein